MITIALPKGRIADETLEIFAKITKESFVFEHRKLILEHKGFRFLLVRNQDVPTYVQYGAADMGVVGLDVLEEKEMDLIRLLDLNIGRCRVVVGVRAGEELDYKQPELKIATKMVNITKKYFAKKATAIDIIKLYGSIELAPLVNLADAIVDIVETGDTMRQNNLVESEIIMHSSAFLIANKNSFYAKKRQILDITDSLEKMCSPRS